jgi:UDP-N-acetylglucosamine/UDP-N-acetyl-alpha-D-glucosaminouronate 4-epimerase
MPVPDAITLVTGGAGFIGSNLVRTLTAQGETVRVLDDFSSGTKENLADAGEVELIVGDIRDGEAVRRAMRGVGPVYHIAADPSVPRSVADPARAHDINATGTLTVLLAARAARAERVVYASSSALYGDADDFPTQEVAELRPVSPYGASKLAGEAYCRTFSHVYDFPTVSMRYFNVYGPGQAADSYYVVPQFVRALMFGESPTIEGDGLQTRDFVFVQDVVDATILASRSGPDAFGRAFNVGSGNRVSIMQILDALEDLKRPGSAMCTTPSRRWTRPVRPSDTSPGSISSRGWGPRWSGSGRDCPTRPHADGSSSTTGRGRAPVQVAIQRRRAATCCLSALHATR